MKILHKRIVAVSVTLAIVVGILYSVYMRPRRVTPILMYHSISTDQDSTLCVSPENFTKQMAFLAKSGYSVISLKMLVQNIKAGRKFLPKTVVVTFDDGFEDNFLYAFPVLSKHDMIATVFLITDYVGKNPGYLNWDQIKVMAENNMDFGGHTRSNVYLPSVKQESRLFDEIEGSKNDIEAKLSEKIEFFCYPLGGFNEKVKKVTELAGYMGACTTNRGFSRVNEDLYELKRVKITNSDMNKPFHFRAKLSGYYNFFRHLRRGD